METNTPEHITEKLRINLQQFESNENRNIIELERAVGICSSALLELRGYVDRYDFKTREDEIRFFKVTKPGVLGEYLYYSKILQLESKSPDLADRKRHLKKMIEEARQYYCDFPEFYQYYRSGSDHLDDKYFVRTQISCYLNCDRFIVDPCFSTSHDYTLAAMKAFEQITEYCKTELKQLKSGQPFISKDGSVSIRSAHKWTGSLRSLLEMIYGVHNCFYSCTEKSSIYKHHRSINTAPAYSVGCVCPVVWVFDDTLGTGIRQFPRSFFNRPYV